MDTSSDVVVRISRLVRLLAIAAGVMFAWLLLTLTLGAGAAHAADDDDPGVLGNALDSIAGTLSSVTTPVLTPVANAAAPVLDTIAPVTDAVAPVVEAVAPAVTPVLGPVVDSLAPVLQPVLEPVATVVAPLAPVLAPVGTIVAPVLPIDGILQPSSPATGSPIDSSSGSAPAHPALPTDSSGIGVTASSFALAAAGAPTFACAVGDAAPALVTASIVVSTTVSALASTVGPVLPLSGALDATSSFFSSSSAFGFGAAAALAFGLFAMHRAWAWRRGPGDESVPSSPTFATDVSPD
ncbi:MAG: hypothetical protein J0I43_06035 [Microbacterium sp.]|uniref:hypothetical protein n=1 Tax=Microbacterium sp. TaxID=51671 RepID=UPI001AC28311|nr:hypothetical protein [Microbacterium sp.]MBN9176910.1 hypothetical protein [Microbacterium sp.]